MMIALGDHAYYSVPLHPPLAHAHLHSESKVSSLTYDALPIVYYNMVLLHLNFIPEEERICRFCTHTHTHKNALLMKIEKNAHTQRQEIHIKKVNDEEGVNEEKLNISNILQWLV